MVAAAAAGRLPIPHAATEPAPVRAKKDLLLRLMLVAPFIKLSAELLLKYALQELSVRWSIPAPVHGWKRVAF
jgi:hypothetical protein